MQWANWYKIPARHGVKSKLRGYLFAIPNGGKRNARTAKILKAEGVMPGVPDLMLAVPVRDYAGLFIELKRPKIGKIAKGSCTDAQKEVMARFSEVGYQCAVAYGLDDAKAIIIDYLALPEKNI